VKFCEVLVCKNEWYEEYDIDWLELVMYVYIGLVKV